MNRLTTSLPLSPRASSTTAWAAGARRTTATTGRIWERWETDFPQAEHNFVKRLGELTGVVASREPARRRLTDDDLGDSPLIFMSDVGYMRLTSAAKRA